MQETLTVYRNEKKYLLSKSDSIRLQEELQMLLEPDSYSKDGFYQVRSLYFDSFYNKDFHEKFDGVQYRQKIRMRIYGTKDDTVKFEIKAKNGAYQHKSSLLMEKEDALTILDGDYGVLLDYGNETAIRLYSILTLGGYRPVSLIEYDRRAFIYPENNTRITVDTNVRTSEMELHLFEEDVPWIPVEEGTTLLEVKYDSKLYMPISKILEKYHLVNVAFSKYGSGRPVMMGCL